jgi:A/G-specific adenine glycosylase
MAFTLQPAFHRRLLHWYSTNGRDLPWRRTDDPYAILVSEFMLQQTQVGTVLPFFDRWLKRFPTFAALAAASETEVLHAWQGLGYYTRATNLHAAAKRVVSHHRGVLPADPEILRTLPGMGRYTANAVATFAFDRSVPIVEANTARLIARLFNIRVPVDSARGRDALWRGATALVPKNGAGRFNSALIDLGAVVCVNRIPKCHTCPVHSFCRAPRPELLPVKRPRQQLERLTESHALNIKRGRVLLEQCSRRWRGLWMLPARHSRTRIDTAPIHTSVFPFTNHRIKLQVFRGARVDDQRQGCRWFSIDRLNAVPIPSPHRRALVACLPLDVER